MLPGIASWPRPVVWPSSHRGDLFQWQVSTESAEATWPHPALDITQRHVYYVTFSTAVRKSLHIQREGVETPPDGRNVKKIACMFKTHTCLFSVLK